MRTVVAMILVLIGVISASQLVIAGSFPFGGNAVILANTSNDGPTSAAPVKTDCIHQKRLAPSIPSQKLDQSASVLKDSCPPKRTRFETASRPSPDLIPARTFIIQSCQLPRGPSVA